MVTRRRFRTVLNVLALYTIAALLIAYFGVNAFTGNHGLRAKHDLEQQIAQRRPHHQPGDQPQEPSAQSGRASRQVHRVAI